MSYRFVHAADIHLDSPLRSLALRDPELASLIGNATRKAFVGIIDLCLAQQVDALLLAGDLYDGEQTSMKTARFLAEQLRRLDQAGIRVFIIRGNHDALSNITRELMFPPLVELFDATAGAIRLDPQQGHHNHRLPVIFHGLSFARPHAPDSLLPHYQPAVAGAVNIGLMHTSLNGAAGHDPYAPCTVAQLQESGFNYWALGHIHKRAQYDAAAGVATGTIIMPGMPQGRDINEAGAKSVSLVTIGDDLTVTVEEHVTSVAQFERVNIDASGIEDWRELIEAIGTGLEGARQNAVSEHLVARLQITGKTPLSWRMLRDHDLLKAEADERGLVAGQCWVEKLELECQAPSPAGGGNTQTEGAGSDPLTELRRLMDEQLLPSLSFKQEMQDMMDGFLKRLPAEMRDRFGADADAAQAELARLLVQGSEDVLANLHEADLSEGED